MDTLVADYAIARARIDIAALLTDLDSLVPLRLDLSEDQASAVDTIAELVVQAAEGLGLLAAERGLA